MRNYFYSVFAIMMAAVMSVSFTACGGDGDSGSQGDNNVTVSVTPTSTSLLSNEGSTSSIYIKTEGMWSITGCPEWLHLTSTSGEGNTSITLTTKSDNFSAEVRSATLTVTAGTASATFTVSQEKFFPDGLDVSLGDMTVMADGFACDLVFPSKAKGYREAFFTESQLKAMTDRDIYNKLMQQTEYSGSVDWTVSPVADPNTNIVYCIAAYGNESNSDGSHKYGPMTMKTITTASKTIWADMYLTLSYTSSRWTANAQKYGQYGTRCQKYYYFGTENEAEMMNKYYLNASYALLAHLIYKPFIAKYPDEYATGGQTFPFSRTGNQFFFGTWGIDDTGKYSAEHTAIYKDLSSSAPSMLMRQRTVDYSSWNKPRNLPSRDDIEKIRKEIRLIKM